MVNVIVLTGYGINCDDETAYAFTYAGATSKIVHVNDLSKKELDNAQIIAFPGGFSYGDDTGSGKALANKLKNKMYDNIKQFVDNGNLVIGICNGFQVLTQLGLLGDTKVALVHNNTARYECRWVELISGSNKCIFINSIDKLELPVAHGEGKFYSSQTVLEQLQKKKQIVFHYSKNGCKANQEFPYNPNGSLDDIAGMCDETGRIFGLMPHPERYIEFTQHYNWTFVREQLRRSEKPMPVEGQGLQIFRNAVDYFR